MQLTPYPDINSFFDTLLLQLKTILGDRLIGVYLFGSLVWGDFEYGSSDIDVLVVTSSNITNNEFDQLDHMQRELAKTYTHAKEGMVEIAYMSENALQTFKTTGKLKLSDPVVPGKVVNLLQTSTPADFNDSPNLEWRYIIKEGMVWQISPAPDNYIPASQDESSVLALMRPAHP